MVMMLVAIGVAAATLVAVAAGALFRSASITAAVALTYGSAAAIMALARHFAGIQIQVGGRAQRD